MQTIIIELPDGGYARVIIDKIANTATVKAHDGSTVVRVASDPTTLALLARVAAHDERDVREILALNPVHPGRLVRLDVDSSLTHYIIDDKGSGGGLIRFREYHRAQHADAKSDTSWPEYWAAIEEHVFEMALESAE